MQIIKAKKQHIEEIAKMHLMLFQGDFLSEMGLEFNKIIYNGLLGCKTCILLVAYEKKVLGIVSGTSNMKICFNGIIKKNFIKLSRLCLINGIKNPKLLLKVFATIIYPNKTFIKDIDAELISLAVIPEAQRKGIARILIIELEKELKLLNVTKYKLIVNVSNVKANKFYIKNGFKLLKTIDLYKNQRNIYVKQL